jgi:hypothetical protein
MKETGIGDVKMPKNVIKINAHLPAIPDWLKIDKSITFALPLKTARELARKLSEIDENVDIELSFSSGKEMSVEIKYDSFKEE